MSEFLRLTTELLGLSVKGMRRLLDDCAPGTWTTRTSSGRQISAPTPRCASKGQPKRQTDTGQGKPQID